MFLFKSVVDDAIVICMYLVPRDEKSVHASEKVNFFFRKIK